MITSRGPAARMLYAERSPWTIPACTIVASASRSWSKYDCSSAGSGRVCASRGAVSPSKVIHSIRISVPSICTG